MKTSRNKEQIKNDLDEVQKRIDICNQILTSLENKEIVFYRDVSDFSEDYVMGILSVEGIRINSDNIWLIDPNVVSVKLDNDESISHTTSKHMFVTIDADFCIVDDDDPLCKKIQSLVFMGDLL